MDRRLGPYRIDARLGAGGMGEVFRATDTRLHRTVAIKVLPAHVLADAAARERFAREARAASALNHPNICTVHDVGESDGQPYLVMEYLEGETLEQRLRSGSLPWRTVVHVAAALADALDTAHARGVVHRDIKPANVFMTRRGEPKLLDFGIAKIAAGPDRADDTAAPQMVTAVGAAVGTVGYMSPEQARGMPLDPRTDIFSLGVTMFEMVTGARPFDGDTAPLVFDAILNREPVAVRTLRSDVPAALESVIADTLIKDRERRLPTARALSGRLQAIRTDPSSARPDMAETKVHAAAMATRRRGAAMAVAAAVILTAIAGTVIWRTREATPVVAVRSLAVLPFDDSAAASAREAVQGLGNALAHALSRYPDLTVIAGTRTAPFATSREPAAAIARALGADAVLQTRVSETGGRLRLDAAVFATDGRGLWSRSYERPRTELFAVERAMTDDLATALNLSVPAGADAAPRPDDRHVDPRAYDLYLRSRYHLGRWNEPEMTAAIGLLEQAVSLDPDFVSAQALLGMFYGSLAFNFRPNDLELRARGHAAVTKALQLDPQSAEAHYARGILIWQPSEAWPHRAALEEFRLALARQPNLDDAWHHRGVVLMHIGRLADADQFYERAIDMNPVNTQAQFRFAPLRNYQGRYDDAMAVLRRIPREVYPTQWTYHMGWTLVTLGRYKEAAQEIALHLADSRVDQGGVAHAARALLKAKTGDRRGAEADVARAIELGKGFGHFHHTALTIGEVYATLGDLGRAQEWVERAANDGFPCYTFFESDPHLAPLRATDRFRSLLAKLRAEWEAVAP